MKKFNFKINKKSLVKNALTLALVLFAVTPMFAGGGALGVAAQKVEEYREGAKLLIKAIAAVVGLIGGIRIYNKWQNGDQDVNKEIMGWAGACIFLLLVPTFLEAIFN
ncbi:DUF4134 domain-containing protein [Riemerella anatipestifer]|uniref:DUF4134 domain-containing protein n=1 Tax=Riemerella anatipestifer TaxID=34085 RepID=UPI0021D5D7C2|nr:DUF4134 domain-containing protein [Riemerella anatipestifer]MCU7559143.1 DUF4134 domain-containing protein [Riemerella anatipestifer]MCW0488339.1 DUF4134 domain-containing protein [Riemerella anatipestifer]MDY3317530.1 DUF4134 domain-containing protein [Riemerella anatipestifer]MDY3319475.1 DUF4134 domain-containing protein [Riemerella anatipestifer]MDY3325746.1 DUF4134 domain-containing protein [Riemerella anatipestifer]